MIKTLSILFLSFITVNGFSQCPKAQAYIEKVQDANNNWSADKRMREGNIVQGWSQLGAWHINKCKCDIPRPKVDAENLVKILNDSRQTIINQYSNVGEIPPVITSCKIGDGSENQNSSLISDPDKGKLIKSATLDFMNAWAAETDNEKIKQISQNLNDTREWVDVFKQFDPENAETFSKIENFAFGASIVVGFIGINKKNIQGAKKYWIDGKWQILSEEEFNERGLKLVKDPFENGVINIDDVIKELDIKLGLDQKLLLREEKIIELIGSLETINNDTINEKKLAIYIATISSDKTAQTKAWFELYNAFESKDQNKTIQEIIFLSEEITEKLILEYAILENLVKRYYLDYNPKISWNEILDLYNDMSENLIWNKMSIYYEHHPEAFIGLRNKLIAGDYSHVSTGNSTLDLFTSMHTSSKNKDIIDFLPISIYHGSLISDAAIYRNFIYENLSLNSPFNMAKGVRPNEFSGNLLNEIYWQYPQYVEVNEIEDDTPYSTEILQLAWSKDKENNKYLFNRKNNISDSVSKFQFIANKKQQIGYGYDKTKASLRTWMEVTEKSQGKKNAKKNKVKYMDDYVIASSYLNHYLNVELATNNIHSYNLKESHLEQINELIATCFAVGMNEEYLLHEFVISQTQNSRATLYSKLEPALIPFSRIRLFRYYLEKSMDISDHIEIDRRYIEENLVFVLEDFIRCEGNYKVAIFVLKDLGIIE